MKEKLKVVFYIVICLVFGIGISYAYIYFGISGNETNLIKAGCLKIDIEEVENLNIQGAIPITDETGKSGEYYQYTITNTCNTSAYYETTFNKLNSTLEADAESKIKLYITGDTYVAPTLLNQFEEVTLTDKPSDVADSYLIDTGYLQADETKTFNLRMWIDYDVTSFNNNFDGRIIIDAVAKNGPNYLASSSAGYQIYKNSTIKTEANYNVIPTNNDSGLYQVINADGDYEYYYRGNVENNYVKFGKYATTGTTTYKDGSGIDKTITHNASDDIIWRIVKINKDGSLKLILDDVIGMSSFNADSSNQKYVEYIYDTTTDSTIKESVDSWYNTNLSTYEQYIKSENYCNDTTSIINNEIIYYGGYTRNVDNKIPTSSCSNADLLKVGLLTVDELALAGAVSGLTNTNYYLYKNVNGWWTMSPAKYDGGGYNFVSTEEESIGVEVVNRQNYAIRPVITLLKNSYLIGEGTTDNKYEVSGIVTDTTIPVIQEISIQKEVAATVYQTINSPLKKNDKIRITVNYNKELTGISPTMALKFGTNNSVGTVSFVSMNGAEAYYEYIIQQNDNGYLEIDSLSGGDLVDDKGVSVDLTLSSFVVESTRNIISDNIAPTCGTITGASTTWTKSNRTIEIVCNDTLGTCNQESYSKTFNTNTQTGAITISDTAGNTTTCNVNAYVDKTPPTCGEITGASASWINTSRNISVACTDDFGECQEANFSNNWITTAKIGNIMLTDKATNTTNCAVNVYLDKGLPTINSFTHEGGGILRAIVNDGTNESGLSSYCINTSSTSVTGCTWTNIVTPTGTQTVSSITATEEIYYLHLKDIVGNISHSSALVVTLIPTGFTYDSAIGYYAKTFNALESAQTLTINVTGYYKVELWGAVGESYGDNVIGGRGAYTTGITKMKAGETYYIYTGKSGGSSANSSGGYNGGGNGGRYTGDNGYYGGGGGATDIRCFVDDNNDCVANTGNLTWSDDLGLNSRIMVAAGGGGSGYYFGGIYGGIAGTLTGLSGTYSTYDNASGHTLATGGTQTLGGLGAISGATTTDNGIFGKGGTQVVYSSQSGIGTGGGGGYFGGGKGSTSENCVSGGAGGSSYISGYKGCVAIAKQTTPGGTRTPRNNISNATCTSANAVNDIVCSYHYSNKIFSEVQMIAGNGTMPTLNGSTMLGNAGSGVARVVFMGPDDAVSEQFYYTGTTETYVIPQTGKYKIELWGAQGGDITPTYSGGKGAYTTGVVSLTKDEVLYFNVGGIGTTTLNGTITGGYNGGGAISVSESCGNFYGSGGGATDVRITSTRLRDRIMVAGGGGGAGYRYCSSGDYAYAAGGPGGTLTGNSAINQGNAWSYTLSTGGTQLAGGTGGTTNGETGPVTGSFGLGGSYTRTGGYTGQAGGGGGYYGGGLGIFMGGGGGSSFISGYLGCIAVKNSDTISPRLNSLNATCTATNATSDVTCSKHYSNKIFTNMEMKAGSESMLTHDGSSTMTGNIGNGYAKITWYSN